MRLDLLNLNLYYREGCDVMNKSKLARIHNCCWKTIDRKLNPDKYKKTSKKREYSNIIKNFEEVIKSKVDKYHCTAKATFLILQKEYGYTGSYSTIQKYIATHKKNESNTVTLRFETIPGYQAQVDWKESLKLVNRGGEQFEINIFLIILGYSRRKFLKLTYDRQQTTVFKCLTKAFEFFGGTTEEIVFDNMKTVVDHAKSNFSNAVVNEKFRTFAKDANFDVYTCRAYRPRTKGKVESVARTMNRLKAYNEEFDNIEELEKVVDELNIELNNEILDEFGQTPNKRFEKEKNTLKSVNLEILETYYSSPKEYKISKESMVTYKGKKYSVPLNLIGKHVTIKEDEDQLYIYYNTDLVHKYNKLSDSKLNYKEDVYKELVKQSMYNNAADDEIEKQMQKNLEYMDNINIERN